MVFSIMVFDITISCRSFVFSHSRAKVSTSLTNVSVLAVATFDLCVVLFNCLSFGLLVCMQLHFSGLCVLLTLLKVAKVERNKQTNGQIHTRVIMTINTLIADFVVCLFVYFANKSKRVEKKEREELNKGLNYVQRKLKQQKKNKKTWMYFY